MYQSSDTGRLKAGKHSRDLFVFNLDAETTPDELISFLNNNGVTVSDIECRSQVDAINKSFRITVDNSDIDKIMRAELWPVRVGVHPYYDRKGTNDRKVNPSDS